MNKYYLLFIGLLFSFYLNSQEDLHLIEGSSPEEILTQLEDRFNVYFSFMVEDLQKLQWKKKYQAPNLEALLSQIFEGSSINFQQKEKTFILYDVNKLKKYSGYIVDELTQTPLAYSSVFTPDKSHGAETDESGYFEIALPPNLYNQIKASYLGYKEFTIDLADLESDPSSYFNLVLDENLTPHLVIKDYLVEGIDLVDKGMATRITPNYIDQMPGTTNEGVFNMIQFLPGISSPSSRASEIYIRGGTPDQALILWEDIPIYHSAHYFGMISAFQPYNLKSIDVYRGGFGAEHGGRVAGLIKMSSFDESLYDSRYGVGADLTNVFGYMTHLWGTQRPSAVSISFRSSYEELIETPRLKAINGFNQQGYLLGNKELATLPDNIRVENEIDFQDVQFKYSSQFSEKLRAEVAALYASNSYYGEIVDQLEKQAQKDSMDLLNYGVKAELEYNANSTRSHKLNFTQSNYSYDYEYSLTEFDSNQAELGGKKFNDIRDVQLNLLNTIQLSKNNKLKFGYNWTFYEVEFDVEEQNKNTKPQKERAKENADVHSLFGNYESKFLNKIFLDLGLRVSKLSQPDNYFWEPRINLSYRINEQLNLSANHSRYHQFVSQLSQFRGSDVGLSLPIWNLANEERNPTKISNLNQLALSYSKANFVADFNIFYRTTSGLNSRAFDFETSSSNDAEFGTSDAYGAEFLLKHRIGRLRSWISYTYSETTFNFRKILKKEFPADFDQRHVLQWANNIVFGKTQFGVHYSYSSGLPYSEADRLERENNSEEEFRIVYNQINDRRLQSMHEVNLSLAHKISPKNKSWNLHIGIAITNLLDYDNVFERVAYVSPSRDRQPNIDYVEKSNLRVSPDFSIRLEW